MAENAQQFKLAYSSPIFDKVIINYIRKYGEMNDAQEFIHNGIPINTDNAALSTFFQLFYQLMPMQISEEISTEQ